MDQEMTQIRFFGFELPRIIELHLVTGTVNGIENIVKLRHITEYGIIVDFTPRVHEEENAIVRTDFIPWHMVNSIELR